MPTPTELIEAQAMQLSPKERADLADKLWLSVHSSFAQRRGAGIDAFCFVLLPTARPPRQHGREANRQSVREVATVVQAAAFMPVQG